jgi:hypothetical protein
MNNQNIDVDVYELVAALDRKPIMNSMQVDCDEGKIHGIPRVGDLGEVDILEIEITDFFGNVISLFVPDGEMEIGFGIEKFKKIIKLSEIFLLEKERSMYADSGFVRKEIFRWIINVHKQHRTVLGLTSYLEKRIAEGIKEFTFFYKLFPLGLEKDFDFGRIRVLAFNEDFLLGEYNKLETNKKPWVDFLQSFNHFKDCIIASITIKATENQAELLARNEVSLTINALKCFFSPESLAAHIQVFDLDFNAHNVEFSRYITTTNKNDRMVITLKQVNGTQPIIINQTFVQRLKSKNIELFHSFLRSERKTEFDFLILQGIEHFGNLISVRNLHERVVLLTSFFEIFLNPDTSSRSKAQTYLKNNVSKKILNEADAEVFKKMVVTLYNIRDKYLHNRSIITIDLEEMLKMQGFAFEFLKRIIILQSKITTKQEFYNYFEIPY